MTLGKHDLIAEGATQRCTPCHLPHYSYEMFIWARDINPDAISADVVCLDCHDRDRSNRQMIGNPSPPSYASKAADVGSVRHSRHDFSSRNWVRRGSCSACHDLHLPNQSHAGYVGTGAGRYLSSSRLWTRPLLTQMEDVLFFYQKRDLPTKSLDDKPNYLIGATALCYDCHSGEMDNSPSYSASFLNPAQDVAFGSNMTDGSGKGYYRLGDGTIPSELFPAPTLTMVQNGANPGGHFIRSTMADANTTDNYEVRNPDGTLLYRISVGDKLPCELCHNPHRGEDNATDEVFFRRDIHAGMDTVVRRQDQAFLNVKLEASKNSRNGAAGAGDGRMMCIYCHGTSDWDPQTSTGIAPLILQTSPRYLTLYGIRIRTPSSPPPGASEAIPPPGTVEAHKKDPGVLGDESDNTACTVCHLHNDMGSANCGSCHTYPPIRGAHQKHTQSQVSGGVRIQCDVCHGVGAQSASHWGHPGDNRPVVPSNINLIGARAYTPTRPSWFGSTWGGYAFFGTPDISYGSSLDSFVCSNVRCHGGGSVRWIDRADDAAFNRVCFDCHDYSVSSFQLPGMAGTVYQATNAAANYIKTLSGFSRGGHGDTGINDASWFRDSAPGSSVPVACVECHEESQPHFGIAGAKPSNPYRVSDVARDNNLPGSDARETPLSNLCTQTNCHPKFLGSGNYAFLSPPKHPNDHWPISDPRAIYVPSATKPVNNQSSGSSTLSPHYDPIGVAANGDPAVGLHIDRYVDHWEWWNPSQPATPTNADNVPFLPLGDSLSKSSGGGYDNNTSTLVTCITCHNPHGTDLFVTGQIPDSNSTLVNIPAYKMLRLNWDDDELCDACH